MNLVSSKCQDYDNNPYKSILFSAYFCFITLTTIGFGDFTPDQKNVDGEQRYVMSY